jgi:hypothetical protein
MPDSTRRRTLFGAAGSAAKRAQPGWHDSLEALGRNALTPVLLLDRIAFAAKEFLKQCTAFVSQHAARNVATMIQLRHL